MKSLYILIILIIVSVSLYFIIAKLSLLNAKNNDNNNVNIVNDFVNYFSKPRLLSWYFSRLDNTMNVSAKYEKLGKYNLGKYKIFKDLTVNPNKISGSLTRIHFNEGDVEGFIDTETGTNVSIILTPPDKIIVESKDNNGKQRLYHYNAITVKYEWKLKDKFIHLYPTEGLFTDGVMISNIVDNKLMIFDHYKPYSIESTDAIDIKQLCASC